MDKNTNHVTYNDATRRYELAENGHVAFARCREEGETFYIDYVEAPVELRGTGAASRLMEGLVKIAAAKNMAVHPICGYAASWIKRYM